VRKYRKTLRQEKAPEIPILSHEGAFKGKYNQEILKTSQLLTAKFIPDKEDNFSGLPYKLKHFKVSEQSLQGGDRNEQNIDIQGMNTRGINPRVKSRVLNVVFGWELDANDLGRITFEGVVSNRYPRFDLRLLYSMPLNSPEKEMKFRLLLWDATKKEERFKSKRALVRKGIRVRWQERIL